MAGYEKSKHAERYGICDGLDKEFDRLRPSLGTVDGIREFILIVSKLGIRREISCAQHVALNGSANALLKCVNTSELERRLAELEDRLLKMIEKNRKLRRKAKK